MDKSLEIKKETSEIAAIFLQLSDANIEYFNSGTPLSPTEVYFVAKKLHEEGVNNNDTI